MTSDYETAYSGSATIDPVGGTVFSGLTVSSGGLVYLYGATLVSGADVNLSGGANVIGVTVSSGATLAGSGFVAGASYVAGAVSGVTVGGYPDGLFDTDGYLYLLTGGTTVGVTVTGRPPPAPP